MINLLYLDDTKDFDPEITNETGNILCVYVYDPEVAVHCCELMPSYECNFVGYTCEKSISDEMNEKLHDIYEDIVYFHCRGIDRLTHFSGVFCTEDIWETKNFTSCYDETDKYDIEDVIEYLRCNGYVE